MSLSEREDFTVPSATGAALPVKAPCIVIKLGARGAIGQVDNQVVSVPPFPISPVDTTGAGDSFAAGFVHAHLLGKDLEDCLITSGGSGTQLRR